ncbi:hypothetical protein [Cupriavidus sp. D39]|uniref:hypothetical protein n=1 Tax=Cupriavidus sp. D39 TaxID=2997877 RepID=UPI00226EF3EF|nr:hypothetical protein [Cupriavidus sp. D39]MCY0854359.1 hypothetical protein [Cupriavidus sp. D39]
MAAQGVLREHPQSPCGDARIALQLQPSPQAEIDAGKWVRVPTGQFSQSTGEPTFSWHEAGKPAAPTTYGKFYMVHLQDATPEDRATIEKHLGIAFEFTPEGSVSWRPAQ